MTATNLTLEDLKELEAAYFKGVKSVKYTDREIVYRSLDEMKRLIDHARQCLGLDTQDTGRGRRRVAQHNKGFC